MRALLKLKSAKWLTLNALALALYSCGGGGGDCGAAVDELTAAGVAAEIITALEVSIEAEAVACDAECAPDDTKCLSPNEIIEAAKLNPHSMHPFELALAFKQIKNGKPDSAKETLKPFLTRDDEPEVYTYQIAALKSGVDALAPLIDLVASQLAPGLAGGLLPAQADFRTLVQNLLQPIIDNLEDLSEYAPVIQDAPDAYVNIPSVPLELDPSALDDSLPADIEMDLGGGWDRPELLAIGSLSNAILGIIDFLFAHSLKLSLGDLDDLNSSAGIAAFIAKSEQLLSLDTPKRVDAAKERFIAALDFIVGKADAGQGKEGLLAAIEAEMVADPEQAGDIIIFKDDDKSGNVSENDTLVLKFIADLVDNPDLELERGDEVISVPFVRDVWVALTELGRALNDNLGGGAQFSLGKYLSAKLDGKPAGTKYLWEELQEEVANDLDATASEGSFDFPGPLSDIEDWVHLNPKAYFANPVALRNLLPAITMLQFGTKVEYEFALECELGFTAAQFANPSTSGGLAADSTIRALCANGSKGTSVRMKTIYFYDSGITQAVTADSTDFVAEGGSTSPDFLHFLGIPVTSTSVASATGLPITDIAVMNNPQLLPLNFVDGMAAPANDTQILADGFRPRQHTASSDPHDDILLSVLLQNPSLGGVLLVDLDPAATTNGPVEATNSILNAGISKIWITFGGHIEALIDGLSDDE